MFGYKFTMSNLVSVFSHALRHRIWEKRMSVINAWIIHLLFNHIWLKIGKCIDSYLVVKVPGIGQKELRIKQNYIKTYWK